MIEDIIVTAITLIGFIPCVLFVVGYWWVTRGRWVKDEAGRFLMALMITLGALYGIGLIGVWHDGEWLSWAGIVIFVAFIAEMWWPLRLLWVAQRERRRD